MAALLGMYNYQASARTWLSTVSFVCGFPLLSLEFAVARGHCDHRIQSTSSASVLCKCTHSSVCVVRLAAWITAFILFFFYIAPWFKSPSKQLPPLAMRSRLPWSLGYLCQQGGHAGVDTMFNGDRVQSRIGVSQVWAYYPLIWLRISNVHGGLPSFYRNVDTHLISTRHFIEFTVGDQSSAQF